MATRNQKANSGMSFISIDDWQDEEPGAGSWVDNPFVGALGVICSVAVLLSISFMSSQADARRRQQFRAQAEADLHEAEAFIHDDIGASPESENLDGALADLQGNKPEKAVRFFAKHANFNAGRKSVVQESLLNLLVTNPSILYENLEVFSIWFDSEDHPRFSDLIQSQPGNESIIVRAMSKLPNPVPALIAELPKHSVTGMAYVELKGELRIHGVHADEISRQLANKLLLTNDPRKFERLTTVLNAFAAQTSDDAALKKLISDAIVKSGRNLTSEQLNEMDWGAGSAIKRLVLPPENAEFLVKLAATKHGAEIPQLSFGGPINPPAVPDVQNADVALKLAKDGKLPPAELLMLGHADSEEAQEFLWEVILRKKSGYRSLNMKFNETSLKGFSRAGISLLNSNPDSAVDSLWTVVQANSQEITRERCSPAFLQELDGFLADKLQQDIRLDAESDSPASLKLAKRLGGRKAALAIGKPAPGKVRVINKFKGLLGTLIALNQPETYETIVNAVINHGGPANDLDKIGEAIEPNFLGRLKIKLKKLEAGDKRQKRTIPLLIHALGQTGTSESVPLLNELTTSKVENFRKTSAEALKKIKQRTRQR